MSPPKTCAVCGDKALGYNFNAVTCESCKAFFRRNALAKKQFTCPFNQNCKITVVTRRFCQKCRLKKCIDIGMNSENIMSEEDKIIKRRKIESNRVKRKQRYDEQQQVAGDSNSCDLETQSNASIESNNNNNSSNNIINNNSSINNNKEIYNSTTSSVKSVSPLRCSSTSTLSFNELNPEMLSGSEIVEIIVNDPDRASQAISNLMRSKEEALFTLEKILHSQVDALRLISHLISYPGDALKIISKIMNSPFNALTVFTKFMSSPTDALEIISKIVSSPQDVLQFIRNLMDSPEDALDIMNKFMDTPAEALKMLNQILSSTHATTQTDATAATATTTTTNACNISEQENNQLLQTLLASPTINRTEKFNMTTNQTSQHANAAATTLVNSNMNETADMRQLMQQIFGEAFSDDGNFNSLDTVLSEIIRMEYLNFTPNLETDELNIKNEQCALNAVSSCQHMQNDNNALKITVQAATEQQTQRVEFLPQQSQPICYNNDNNYNGTKHLNLPRTDLMCERPFNEAEQAKLRELKVACEALYDPIDAEVGMFDIGDDRIKPQEMHHKFMSLINLTAVAIKRLIKMAKKISAFRNMCQEDQVALLKGGCTEMMIMRSVMTFDMNRNIWNVPHATEGISTIRADLLKVAKCNLYEELLKFNNTFDEKWRIDENIILMLCAIVLFTPSRACIVHKDVITLEQNSYYYLLRRYLETTYSGCEAKSTFMKLMQKVTDVGRLNQVIIGVYLNVNPAQMEPLIREIFDIKPH